MRKTFTFYLLPLLCLAVTGLQAQTPYIDPIYEVSAPTLDTFGQNIDVFQIQRRQGGDPNATPLRQLQMDVYQPVDDTTSLRPVVVVFPTGNFLPQYVNRGLYGTRQDSAVVQILSQLTARGYVGIAADYRVGWNPLGDESTRTSTLLQAAYRGGQDAHMLARYLRKTVAEEENPYRIDTSKIVYWGLGTGGYVTMTHAYLDRIEEVLADDRFYGADDQPYVSLAINSNPQGTLPAEFQEDVPSNVPNHVGYNSSVAMSINANGALGDIDWMEGKDDEPITLGYHAPSDIFAPFSYGDVIVPTTEDLVIGCVAGTEQIIEKANMLGNNDAIMQVNMVGLGTQFGELANAVNAQNEEYKDEERTLSDPPACPDQDFNPTFELSHDNMYPFLNQGAGAAYNYVNEDAARARIAAFNTAGGELDADEAIGGEVATNPNALNPAAAKLVLDTMIAHFIPRAYVGLGLGELMTSTELIAPTTVGLELFPNPATADFTVQVADAYRIRQIDVYDMRGSRVAQVRGLDQSSYTFDRSNLANGAYIVQLRFDEGTTARKVFLR